MAYNTGNPVPSTEAKDFVDNCENFDSAVNSLESTFQDRLGVTRSTYEGVVQGLSFFNVGTFAVGFTLTNSRQTLTYSGHEYGWSGAFPKVVNAGSTPTPLGSGGWIDRSDVTLRSELSDVGGPFNLLDAGEYMPVGVLPSKVTDLSSSISLALANSVSSNIYPVKLRSGVFLSSGLVVPANASLIGSDVTRAAMPGNWINADPDETHGTTVWATDTSNPAFDMHTGSQIKNVQVWNKGQTKIDDVSSIVAFPPIFKIASVDTVFGNADNVVVDNVSALNCYTLAEIGDGINPVGRAVLSDIFANSYSTGVHVRTLTGDVVVLDRVYIENLFTTDPAYMPNIHEHIYNNVAAFVIEDSQGVTLSNSIALNYGTGLLIVGNTWAHVDNFLADQCGNALTVAGCDKLLLTNSSLVQNRKPMRETARIYGNINKNVSISNSQIGSYYGNIKTGIFSYHGGKVLVSNSQFETKFPAVLNTGDGEVSIDNCGLDYSNVVGQHISIDGGPSYSKGAQMSLTNLNPTVPALPGWTYTTPANVSAITNGIRISGAGNNTFYYKPADISTDNLNVLRYGPCIYTLNFDLVVRNQAGSPRLNILVTDNLGVDVVECFQICSDHSSSNSALPEGEVLHISLILPWHLNARSLAFSLPNQTNQVLEITNMTINKLYIDIGYTGLEFFKGFRKFPSGYFDPKTGNSVLKTVAAPDGGAWVAGDRWEYDYSLGTPTTGSAVAGVYNGSIWLTTSVLS